MNKKYIFGQYIIEYPDNIYHQVFDEGKVSGIKFVKDTWTYQIVSNSGWERILINCQKTYHNRDLPFNLSTVRFLPDEIQVRKNSE